MKIACIYWSTSSVGGIATHLNSLRSAAIKNGDTFDILHSMAWKNKTPQIFPERKWIRGGDTKIWVCGEIPSGNNNAASSARWLEQNYDAVVFGFICPHKTKAYPEPQFLPLYDVKLPKLAFVMDGYWDDYSEWAIPLLKKLKGVLCPLESYATPLRKLGVKNLKISAFPFQPQYGSYKAKEREPLLIWPNQWKNIKGITQFLACVPELTTSMRVELYSNGIRYYQLRTEPVWKAAVGKDHFQSFDGNGKAVFFGNVDTPEIAAAYQRAWFTVNLQGMNTKKETYRRGSYNNTEVEALYYGACPILHSTTTQTALPPELYIPTPSADQIPSLVRAAIKDKFPINPRRMNAARDFVLSTHLASHRYMDLRNML